MSETASGQLPLQIDALWRRGPLTAGAYASYALVAAAGSCDPGARCSASSVSVGVEAAWTFPDIQARVAPWVGAGAGYEWTSHRSERDGGALEWRYRGVEVLSLQAGADLRVLRRVAVGPFFMLTIGRFARVSLDTPVESGSREISGKAFHEWLEFGIRGTFGPWE